MTTARDIIQDAIEQMGVYSPGETISDADAARGLDTLNIMIDEWGLSNLFIFQINSLSVSVVSGTAAYTVGLAGGATVSAQRPWRVTYGPAASSITVTGVTTPVNVVSAVEFQALLGNAPVPGLPDTLWFSSDYPLSTMTVLPTPNVNGTLSVPAWNRLAAFPAYDTPFTLAPGHEEGLRDNLSVELQPYFRDAQLAQSIVMAAMESKKFLLYTGVASRATLHRFPLSTPQSRPRTAE